MISDDSLKTNVFKENKMNVFQENKMNVDNNSYTLPLPFNMEDAEECFHASNFYDNLTVFGFRVERAEDVPVAIQEFQGLWDSLKANHGGLFVRWAPEIRYEYSDNAYDKTDPTPQDLVKHSMWFLCFRVAPMDSHPFTVDEMKFTKKEFQELPIFMGGIRFD